MTTFKVKDRVAMIAPYDSSDPGYGPPIRSRGTVIWVADTDEEVLVEFDDAFSEGHAGNDYKARGRDGHCFFLDTRYLSLLEEGKQTTPTRQEGTPPGYTRTKEGFLTNPDNWVPGKLLI